MAEERADCNREMAGLRATILPVPASVAPAASGLVLRPALVINRCRPAFAPESAAMPKSPEDLFAYLDGLGIPVRTKSHPPLFTVADSQALRGEIPGGHTKNLFLKDKKDNFFLVTVGEEAEVDLKQIHHVIGAAGRVSFGKPEPLMDLLGVTPGAVTAFGLINDTAGRVKFVIDEALMHEEIVNAHPLTNEATTSIAGGDLLAFVRATGHEPHILKVSA
jgi:Ala-tRNA(Pro) deacylase